jgi:hypothetical protein
MKTIDKTPLLDEKGNLGFSERIQGMFRYGFNWPNELQAQRAIITFFDRQLEKGYTLIRNLTLGQSGIMIPMIVLGPAGIFVIQITYLRGRFQAKGDSWNVASGDRFKPADVNLIQQTARMARALQVFIERQGVKVPVGIEPVLIAGDPGLFIESERPTIKVMMIDGIKPFVSGLATGRPALSAEAVHEFTERILNPRPARKEPGLPPVPELQAAPGPNEPAGQGVSRARAIFNAAEEAKPFNPADFDFAMEEDQPPTEEMPAAPREAGPEKSRGQVQPNRRRILGMTPIQFIVLAALGLCLICVLVVGIVYVIPLVS